MNDSDAIDPSALDALSEMVGGDPAFVAEMIDTFFVETVELLETMRAALASANAPELHRAAHSLKSTSATFGAGALSDLCQRLEELGKSGQVDGAEPLVAGCAAEYDRVAAALTRARPQA